ncbi:hypothetical protein A0H81_09789 [Grifola frondosa]|uniref:Uncharacterized protein n=1 Tax=Grifola frondosa TaxID=5627 RepID=A0A1C7M0M7_GRIFR|nr:hypothetical protein A0H81_09789 [Grifola frondosa]
MAAVVALFPIRLNYLSYDSLFILRFWPPRPLAVPRPSGPFVLCFFDFRFAGMFDSLVSDGLHPRGPVRVDVWVGVVVIYTLLVAQLNVCLK